MIEVRHLTKRYGDRTAVEDLSFAVEDGTIYGFLGPNGAGKTTTMNIMTGCLAATEGEVIVNGHDIAEEPEAAKRTIGYLPEIPPVYPELTVEEYLNFAAELKKIPKEERKREIDDAVRELGLDEVRGRLIRNLSKGFRQRVGFAQAILGGPQTLILDEPTVGLDPRQIIEIRALIRKLGETHTVILSSHILSEVSEICDRILIISRGRIVACDTPENLLKAGESRVRLDVLVQGTRENALAAAATLFPEESLKPIKPEVSIEAEEAGDGMVRLTIRHPEGDDIRGDLSRALFERGCAVIEMKTRGESLESIFLKLTGEDLGPGSAREADLEDEEDTEEEPKGFFRRLFGARGKEET